MAWLSIAAAVSAQDAVPSQQEIDHAFRRVLANPQDLDASYVYAELLVKAGNYESAAAALERMLLIDGTQYRLLLELGVLYFRLGSNEVARDYLERALRAPGATEETQASARRYLADIENQVSRHRFAGNLTGGLRYQSNANGGIVSSEFRSLGTTIPRPTGTGPVSDGNGFVFGVLEHAYDLQTQNDAALVTQLFAYGTRQFEQTQTNLGLVEATSGVRFSPFKDVLPGFGIRPHVVLGVVSLDDRRFSATAGPGFDLNYQVSERGALQLTYQLRFVDVSNQPTVAEAANLRGSENLARLTFAYQILRNLSFFGQVTYRDDDTRRIYFDNRNLEVSGSLITRYSLPWFETPWSVSAGFTHRYWEYGGPDPSVDPSATRRDREWRGSLVNEIPLPIATGLVFVQTFDWDRITSNIPNYGRDNKMATVALSWRF